MFPLLDLDDDVIVAALGFSDPRSLCSTTMVCRRLRRLADTTWAELDKNIDANKREGGDTPRERVLSSFAVHELATWVSQVAKTVETRDFHELREGYKVRIISPEDLGADNYLFFLRISGCTTDNQTRRTYIKSFVQVSDEQQRSLLANNSPIDLQLNEYRIRSIIHRFLTDLVSGPETFSARHFTNGVLNNNVKSRLFNYFNNSTNISIIAVNRQTLAPSILFKNHDNGTAASCRVIFKTDGSRRLEIRDDWIMCKAVSREVALYFENNSYGLRIGRYDETDGLWLFQLAETDGPW